MLQEIKTLEIIIYHFTYFFKNLFSSFHKFPLTLIQKMSIIAACSGEKDLKFGVWNFPTFPTDNEEMNEDFLVQTAWRRLIARERKALLCLKASHRFVEERIWWAKSFSATCFSCKQTMKNKFPEILLNIQLHFLYFSLLLCTSLPSKSRTESEWKTASKLLNINGDECVCDNHCISKARDPLSQILHHNYRDVCFSDFVAKLKWLFHSSKLIEAPALNRNCNDYECQPFDEMCFSNDYLET